MGLAKHIIEHSEIGLDGNDVNSGTIDAAYLPAALGALSVADTTTVDLTLTGSELSADVLPGGVDHDALLNTHNLTTDIDHGSISGIADDDHTQYVLSAGRGTSQTIYGGTTADDYLFLRSTSDANSGYVYLEHGPTENVPWVAVGQLGTTTNIYVNSDSGNDTTGDGTAGSPYATVSKAISTLPKLITASTYINVSGSTAYDEAITLAGYNTISQTITIRACDLSDNLLYGNGDVSSATNTTLVDSTQTWANDIFIGGKVHIVAGTGAGQIRDITDNDGTSLTVGVAWTTNPDSTSDYAIISPVKFQTASLTNAFFFSGIDRVSVNGFQCIGYTSYAVRATAAQSITYSNMFLDCTYGGNFVSSNVTAQWNYLSIPNSSFGGYVLDTSKLDQRYSNYVSEGAGQGYGITARQQSFVSNAGSTNTNFIGLSVGVNLESGAQMANLERCNYVNCTTNYQGGEHLSKAINPYGQDGYTFNRGYLNFDGSNDYVNIGDITELNSVAAFSVSFFFKQDVLDANDIIFYKTLDAAAAANQVKIGTDTTASGSMYFAIGDANNNFGRFEHGAVCTAGRWHHFLGVFDGSQADNASRMKVYIDGVQRTLTFTGTIPATTVDLSTKNAYIGYSSTAFDGTLHSVSIYSDAKTAANAVTLASGTEITTNRVHFYSLDHAGATQLDSGTNPMNGTASGVTFLSSGYVGIGNKYPHTYLGLPVGSTREYGISFGQDAFLYRYTKNELKTDGNFSIVGNLGVNTGPSAYNNAGNEYILTVSRTFTDTTAAALKRGISSTLSWNPSIASSDQSVQAMYCFADIPIGATAGTTGQFIGAEFTTIHRANTTISALYGNKSSVGTYTDGVTDSTGTITDLYGYYVAHTKTTSSTITNGYGIYIGAVYGSTKSYSIYASSTTAKNYFGGYVGIGASELAPSTVLQLRDATPTITFWETGSSFGEKCARIVGTATGSAWLNAQLKFQVHAANSSTFTDELIIGASATTLDFTFGSGTAGKDVSFTFNGETNDGVLKWMEDEDYFQFNDSVIISGSLGITGTRITKGWFTDLESTNMPTVGGTPILTSLTAPQFTTIELGHATDTTISRVSAGVIAVEGVTVPTISSTNTLTNKRITRRVVTTTDDSTAVIDIDTTDVYELSAVANDTTFSTTGTPTDGQELTIRFKDAGAPKNLTWDGVFVAIGVTAPTVTVAGKWHYVKAHYNSGASKWHILATGVQA